LSARLKTCTGRITHNHITYMNVLSSTARKPLLALLLIAAVALTPAIGFAKNEGHKDKKEDRSEISSSRQVSVEINNGGRTSVTGAKVTSVSGDTVVAQAEWGSATLSFNVKVSSSTSIKGQNGKNNMPLSQIAVGDIINFSGSLNTSTSGLTVNASQIKDVTRSSTQNPKPASHVFEGKLQSAIGTTSLPTSFSLLVDSVVHTVNVPANALILAKNWTATNLSVFQSGDTVRVFGSLQNSTSTVIDALVVRNASR
jgi:hypothetical protein